MSWVVAMDKPFLGCFDSEEARIREAYARRQGGSIYSLFNPGHLLLVQERERRVLRLLERYGYDDLDSRQILEVGCGKGYWLRDFVKWGARPENIVGIDLLADCISEARRLCPEDIRLKCGNVVELDFLDGTFDLVLQSTVFSSILDPRMKLQIASEILRVVKPTGLILWYDYHINNQKNPDVQAVKKGEIYHLFSGCKIELQRITLAPPLARLLAPYSWLACSLLERIPWLCTHYLGTIRRA
jgi:ubiquinone/menaquinone biosynthesis C-methylase UbiE